MRKDLAVQHIDLVDPQPSRRVRENDPARRRAVIDGSNEDGLSTILQRSTPWP